MEDLYVRHVKLLGFEKRFFPSQHYVYMLMVKWSDLSEKLIYRTYPEIHTFHKSLKEMFPIESGEIDKKDRIIPSLPDEKEEFPFVKPSLHNTSRNEEKDAIVMQRTSGNFHLMKVRTPRWMDSQKSRENRQNTLVEYCHSLINLPPHISRCKLLNSFLKVRLEDENPPAPNTVKKSETFLVSKGNTSEISAPILLDTYRVIADFTKTSKHELNLHTGDLVDIVEKSQNGWWFCQCESKQGWVPATYLEPLDGPEEAEDVEPNYEGEQYTTIKAYKAQQEDEISLELGEVIEVIHKLLDGWWVVRKGEETGHFPSMFLQKASKDAKYEAKQLNLQGQNPPPRRSTIRNAKSIHNRDRRRLSQDVYRKNSRRYLQHKGSQLTTPGTSTKKTAKSPLRERKNQNNIVEQSGSSSEAELKKESPVIPPRPSPELILERCTDNTRRRVSIHLNSSSSG